MVLKIIITILFCFYVNSCFCFDHKGHYKVFVNSNVINYITCDASKSYKIKDGKVIRHYYTNYTLIDTSGLWIYIQYYQSKFTAGYFGYFSFKPCSEIYPLSYHQLKKRVFKDKEILDLLFRMEGSKYFKPSEKYNCTYINGIYNDYLKHK